jgi:hypothetical protein
LNYRRFGKPERAQRRKSGRRRGCPRRQTEAESGGGWIQALTLLGPREVVRTVTNIPRPCSASERSGLHQQKAGRPPPSLRKPRQGASPGAGLRRFWPAMTVRSSSGVMLWVPQRCGARMLPLLPRWVARDCLLAGRPNRRARVDATREPGTCRPSFFVSHLRPCGRRNH